MAASQQRLTQLGLSRDPYRVMLVDDSIIFRTMFRRLLQDHAGIHVVATAGDGVQALEALDVTRVEVALLDLEMPVMDGMQALPRLLAAAPDLRVITVAGTERTTAGLALSTLFQGACDLLAKPRSSEELNGERFRRELVGKVCAWAAVARDGSGAGLAQPSFRPLTRHEPPAAASPIALRPFGSDRPTALAIVCGDGGPQGLYRLFGQLAGATLGPSFVHQPLPAPYALVLAEHLAAIGARPCVLARPQEAVQGGRIHLAAAEQTMTVQQDTGGPHLRVMPGWSKARQRAADAMLTSLAEGHGSGLLVVVLSGAGEDGLVGARAAVAAGASVIVQDRDSSPLWGLPGTIAQAGLASAVLPLTEIGPLIRARFAAAS
jgi:two-component system chemotaxis response regulator CheB